MLDSKPVVQTTGPWLNKDALITPTALQQAILYSGSFPVIATDTLGIIQLFNMGAERLLGYRAEEVIGRITPFDLYDPQEAQGRTEALTEEFGVEIALGPESLAYKASRGIEDVYEITCICKDGRAFPARVSITALRNTDGGIIGYLLIVADNSLHDSIEEELKAARLLADRASLAKSEFLSSMSHELRTPLGAILGFAQLLESGQPPPTTSQGRSIDQILKAGWYLLELINEVLDLAVIESGTLSLNLEPVSLFEVLYECHAIVEQHARKRTVRVFYPKFVAAYSVSADRMRLKQVLINLLSNAIKYNKLGGAVIVTCVVVDPGRVQVRIEDTGEGLSAEKIGQLFQPFNRLGQESSGEEGTGIGLVLCKKLVELMGGVISVESMVGEGSIFSIDLALMVQRTPEHGAVDEPVVTQPVFRSEDWRCILLCIEDNPADLMLMQELVAQRSDIGLLTATDGVSGIEIARAYRPDLILINISRPGVSGIKAFRVLADDPLTRDIPVAALSANGLQRDIEQALSTGFFRYLTKPVRLDAFTALMDEAIKMKSVRGEH